MITENLKTRKDGKYSNDQYELINVKGLENVYRKHQPYIYEYICRKTKDISLSEDLTQIVFTRICDDRSRYQGHSDIRAYLKGIAKNVINEHSRTKIDQPYPPDAIKTLIDTQISQITSQGLLEDLEKKEFRGVLEDAISKLPPKSREIAEKYYQNARNYSAGHDKNVLTRVLSDRLRYGLVKLKKALKKYLL